MLHMKKWRRLPTKSNPSILPWNENNAVGVKALHTNLISSMVCSDIHLAIWPIASSGRAASIGAEKKELKLGQKNNLLLVAMGFGKTWHANLTLSPAPDDATLRKIVDYLGTSDYSTITCSYHGGWCRLHPSKRMRGETDRYWGSGKMHECFNEVLNKRDAPVAKFEWHDERNGGSTPYECQDIAKLLRICKKLGVDCNGNVEGEGFAHGGDVYFIRNNSIHIAAMKPGPIAFADADNWDSDAEEEPVVKKARKNKDEAILH